MQQCCGPSRRKFFTNSLGGLLTASLPWWQQSAAFAARAHGKAAESKSCILLWMNGGPSHLDTFDPKPGTPNGGSFKTIKSSVRGLDLCEHLPRVAEQAHHLAVIRSMTSREGNHDRGSYLMHTGYAPSATIQHPSFGAWVSHELGDPQFDLPNFVSIRGPSIGAGFLGIEHSPFQIQEPAQGIKNLALARDVDGSRFSSRLEALDILQRNFRQQTNAVAVANHDRINDKSVRLMRSPLVKAFDLNAESSTTRARYGDTEFGKGCLLARRLIETGVKFVEVTLDGWDTHYDNFTAVKGLCQELDPGYAALIRDLAERKLLDDTLVIWMGEFGRTPKISQHDGRDHYPQAWSAVLAGGGVRAGQVYGETDAEGAKVTKDQVTVPNFFATLATLLHIDPTRELMSPVGRPISISEAGQPVRGLIAG